MPLQASQRLQQAMKERVAKDELVAALEAMLTAVRLAKKGSSWPEATVWQVIETGLTQSVALAIEGHGQAAYAVLAEERGRQKSVSWLLCQVWFSWPSPPGELLLRPTRAQFTLSANYYQALIDLNYAFGVCVGAKSLPGLI